MQEKKNKALHWPIGIVIAIFGVVALSTWTIEQANKYPVMEDEFNFQKYQAVEEDYYNIQKRQEKFDKNYKISYSLKKFKIGENTLVLTLTDKAGKSVKDVKIKTKITRPLSIDRDRFIEVVTENGSKYTYEKFDIDQLGRWQILSKIQIGNAVSFTKTDINATK